MSITAQQKKNYLLAKQKSIIGNAKALKPYHSGNYLLIKKKLNI
jgi:hypothetical protein